MLGAGLLARKALAKGLSVKPWVKTSLAPGSQVVTDYLTKAGLQERSRRARLQPGRLWLHHLHRQLRARCREPIADAVEDGDLVVCSVLSGNRNFEGRISPHCRANYLASPPLVVAYALAGIHAVSIWLNDPLGDGSDGKPVFLRDIWPSNEEIGEVIEKALTAKMFSTRYANVFEGPEQWQKVKAADRPDLCLGGREHLCALPAVLRGHDRRARQAGRCGRRPGAGVLGDSVTTDHISPAGSIKKDGPAGDYLLEHQVRPHDFNSYGARRGNHEVMMRGTFANIRIRNEMVPGIEGGMTKHLPSGEVMPIYDAAMRYQAEGVPLVIVAGKEYGTGSSRDWAAKGTRLLGVKAVITESFERIHRSNLVGMGILPLQFKDGQTRKSLNLTGAETVRHHRCRRRHPPAHGHRLPHPPPGRQDRDRHPALPHRYGGRGGVLPPRRHPALRAAQPDEGGVSCSALSPRERAARRECGARVRSFSFRRAPYSKPTRWAQPNAPHPPIAGAIGSLPLSRWERAMCPNVRRWKPQP